ncbi:frizzled-1-like, partial [Anneissia japonica]|uniref:frizzled-1-like n=1 Tax=Anneissia japonica TaxID=1529436 RepID=UPI0014256D24
MDQYGFGWPESLNCSSLSNENCFDAGFSTEIQNPDGSCEDIILPMCLNMSYSQTSLPNVLGHTSQFDALTAIIDNVILVGCSPTMLPFLCSVYTPMCTADGSAKPCRSLCQQTMYECQQLLTLLNIKWPEELECSQFTDEDPSCMTDNATASTVPTTEVESQCEPLK